MIQFNCDHRSPFLITGSALLYIQLLLLITRLLIDWFDMNCQLLYFIDFLLRQIARHHPTQQQQHETTIKELTTEINEVKNQIEAVEDREAVLRSEIQTLQNDKQDLENDLKTREQKEKERLLPEIELMKKKISDAGNNIKQQWRLINNLLNRKRSDQSYPTITTINGQLATTDAQKAASFNQFFATIASKLSAEFENNTNWKRYTEQKETRFKFKQVSVRTIQNTIAVYTHSHLMKVIKYDCSLNSCRPNYATCFKYIDKISLNSLKQ